MCNCGNPREPLMSTPADPWWILFTNDVNENDGNEKGHFASKTGGNHFFFLQKTETESWGLPLMNGGLKTIEQLQLQQSGSIIIDIYISAF